MLAHAWMVFPPIAAAAAFEKARTTNWTTCVQPKTLVDISKEDLDLGEDSDEEKAKIKEIEEEYAAFTAWMKTSLGDKVEKVIVSKRLAGTPCILVTSKFGWCVTAFHATSLARAYDVVPRSLEAVSRRFSSPTLCLLPFNVPTFHRD